MRPRKIRGDHRNTMGSKRGQGRPGSGEKSRQRSGKTRKEQHQPRQDKVTRATRKEQDETRKEQRRQGVTREDQVRWKDREDIRK